MSENKGPVKTFKTRVSPGLQIQAWAGEKGLQFSVTKSYKAADGWKKTSVLFAADLAALHFLSQEALSFSESYQKEEQPQGGYDHDDDGPRF